MIELVRGKVIRVERKHGDRGLFFDITHKYGIPLPLGELDSWFLNIPPDAEFAEGEEVTLYLKGNKDEHID